MPNTEDINDDGVIDQYDIVYLGNAMPLFTGGAGFNARYKNWTFSSFFHTRYGQKVVNKPDQYRKHDRT